MVLAEFPPHSTENRRARPPERLEDAGPATRPHSGLLQVLFFLEKKSPTGVGSGAAILRSPVNIDAVRSIFGQGHVASVLSKIYVQMKIALCRSAPLSSGFRMPAILHACA